MNGEIQRGHPEIRLARQIRDAERRGRETGEDMKPVLLQLRLKHYELTGATP